MILYKIPIDNMKYLTAYVTLRNETYAQLTKIDRDYLQYLDVDDNAISRTVWWDMAQDYYAELKDALARFNIDRTGLVMYESVPEDVIDDTKNNFVRLEDGIGLLLPETDKHLAVYLKLRGEQ